jgi:DnaJ homolog subfamily C member 19
MIVKLIVIAAVLAGLYLLFRRVTAAPPGLSPSDARAILGVEARATPAEIRDAHRRLIERNHPDRGGTAALAARINAARDVLLRETPKGQP